MASVEELIILSHEKPVNYSRQQCAKTLPAVHGIESAAWCTDPWLVCADKKWRLSAAPGSELN